MRWVGHAASVRGWQKRTKKLALKLEERKSFGISKRRRVENRPASGFWNSCRVSVWNGRKRTAIP
jgi:hypothetical protein